MRRQVAGVVTLVAACWVAACASDDAAAALVTVRDSAEVRIVENGAVDVPTIDLADQEVWAFSDYLFVQVRDGAIRDDGYVAVADVRGDEVVVLDSNGSLAYVLGGHGEGPEDLNSPFSILWLGGDTLLAQDMGNARFGLFAGEASAATFRVPVLTAYSRIMARVPGTTEVVLDDGAYNPVSDEEWVTNEVYLYDWVAAAGDTIHAFDIAEGVDDMTSPREPFQPYGAAAAHDSSLFTVRGDRAEIRRLDLAGRYVESWRWSEAPPEVSDSIWDAWVEWRRGLGDSASEDERRREIGASRRLMSGVLPYTSTLLADAAGRVWVAEYSRGSRPRRYRVFDGDGRYLADVRVPPGTEILDITGDRLLAAVLDDFDVPTVTLFDLSVLSALNAR